MEMTDAEIVENLNTIGVTLTVQGDVLTLAFARNGMREDWLAVSPMMLNVPAWASCESIQFGGRTWVKCEGGLA